MLAHPLAKLAYTVKEAVDLLPWGKTKVYELIASIFIFAFLWLRKRSSQAGFDFLWFTALTSGSRLILEAFRGDSSLIFNGIRSAQVVAWFVLAAALIAGEILSAREKTAQQ